MSNERIKVMIVDDHLVIRNGFATFLKTVDDIVLVGEASDGKEAIDKCRVLKPDVVLIDMIMPKMSGAEAIESILKEQPQVKFIALTSFSEKQDLVLDALDAGALGYLFKNISINELADAIRAVYAGKPMLAADALSLLVQAKRTQSDDNLHLSERELEILRLIADGLSNQMIADKLSISISTIKFHVSTILGKLHASNRTEAVAIARQNNLLR